MLGQRQRRRAAQAAGRAGDEGDTIGKIEKGHRRILDFHQG